MSRYSTVRSVANCRRNISTPFLRILALQLAFKCAPVGIAPASLIWWGQSARAGSNLGSPQPSLYNQPKLPAHHGGLSSSSSSSPDERSTLTTLLQRGFSLSSIDKRMGRSKATTANAARATCAAAAGTRVDRRGRPKTLTDRERRAINKAVDMDGFFCLWVPDGGGQRCSLSSVWRLQDRFCTDRNK